MNRTNVLLLIAPAISILCAIGCGDDATGQGGESAQGSGATQASSANGPGSSVVSGASTTANGTSAIGTSTTVAASASATDAASSSSTGVVDCGPCDTACEAGVCIAATQVTTGYRFGCTLLASGSIRCWGSNDSCQLGDGTDVDRFAPGPLVPEIAGVVAIASAPTDDHSCAVTASGVVWCWGSNYLGQLGGEPAQPCQPVEVGGLPAAAAEVAAGGEGDQGHTCARLVDGTVWCWGKTGGATPTQIASVSNASAIAVGGWHACAIVDGGAVACWGQNVRGQLGTGSFDAAAGAVPVTGITTATSLALGRVHSCARLADGTAVCWGDNDDGKLGIGPAPDDVPTPTAVSGLSGVVKLAAGQGHTCALLDDGTARCWGDNILGQLGVGSFDGESEVPLEVMTLAGATDIATGSFHTCAVVAGGDVACWGYNQGWQLGSSGNSWSVPHAVEWP